MKMESLILTIFSCSCETAKALIATAAHNQKATLMIRVIVSLLWVQCSPGPVHNIAQAADVTTLPGTTAEKAKTSCGKQGMEKRHPLHCCGTTSWLWRPWGA